MWLKLGEKEIINLNHVVSIRKGENFTIEIRFSHGDQKKVLPFDRDETRDQAFTGILTSLQKLGQAIQ